MMIDAFHSNWTAPFFALKGQSEYYIDDFEILTTILSALEWRKYNGSIKMVTDEVGAEYYNKLGITSIWNNGIDVCLENINNKEINPSIFWAAGKIAALENQSRPCAMIDTDFIVWKPIYDIIKDEKVVAIHKEEINDIYPDRDTFKMKDGYVFEDGWNWDVKPFNTAFVYINSKKFKDYYTDSSIDFMKNLTNSEDRLINMVFAEQRLFSMCAERIGITPKELISLEELAKDKQEYFTHIWGLKDRMRKNNNIRERFCKRCISRIINDFPEYEEYIFNIDSLRGYYNELKEE